MTVRDNLAFPLKMAKLPNAEIRRRVDHAAHILGLGELLERRPASLSGGQRQRVAMGRAIVREPRAFLMDEPLSNLDVRLRVQMRTEIARLQRRLGATTVYVTHDQTEAMTLGERVAVLQRGVVQQIGTPQALYAHPRNLFVASFIGSPPMNLFPAQLQGARLKLPMLECALPAAVTRRLSRHDGPLIAGIRPEHTYLAGTPGSDGETCFTAMLEVREWLGSDLFLYCDIGGSEGEMVHALPDELRMENSPRATPLVARVDAACTAREGERVELCLDSTRLHLFDARSGESLLGPSGNTNPA
jgi:multiple sugar transport system ATP-binding protein